MSRRNIVDRISSRVQRYAGLLALLPYSPAVQATGWGTYQGSRSKGVHTIYVPMVHNVSTTANFETEATDALIRRFNNDGTLLAVNSPGADSVVDVTITSVDTTPQRSTISDTTVTAEYNLKVTAEVTFTNRRTGRIVLNKAELIGNTTFYLQNDVIEGERQALPLACEDLAKNIVENITEGW